MYMYIHIYIYTYIHIHTYLKLMKQVILSITGRRCNCAVKFPGSGGAVLGLCRSEELQMAIGMTYEFWGLNMVTLW